tara:strand:+ start:67 stop:510 length:444 start_codon:yes stop_codon:yes gene_type:complete
MFPNYHHRPDILLDMNVLCKCGETDINKMMNKGGGRKSHSLCKSCHNFNTIERGRKNRLAYIQYKGGKCSNCGYDKCPDALEFHHPDPAQKDPTFRSIRYWGIKKAQNELDKCILLCCNCHREIHYQWTWPGSNRRPLACKASASPS